MRTINEPIILNCLSLIRISLTKYLQIKKYFLQIYYFQKYPSEIFSSEIFFQKYFLSHLITLDSGSLLQPGQHDDGGAPLLPDHPPEVCQCLRQWTLAIENYFRIFSLRLSHSHKYMFGNSLLVLLYSNFSIKASFYVLQIFYFFKCFKV